MTKNKCNCPAPEKCAPYYSHGCRCGKNALLQRVGIS
jgi:hypothetical protein